MSSQFLNHVAGVLATAILVSLVTAGAAIAASGIGHAFVAARPATACTATGCSYSPHQAKPAHLAKASAAIAIRGARGN
jgi:hypothetical protein